MAITYGAAAGTAITSYAMNETLPASQPTNLLQVRVSDDISTAGNGNIGNGTNGIGNSYVGRLIIINLGVSEERRMCTAETDEGTTFLLTVHEEWSSQPVGSTDTVHVPYEPADIEDGGAGGGIGLGGKTGLWELSNTLTINTSSGLQIMRSEALEADDDGVNVSVLVNGDFYAGYESAGQYVAGGICTAYNNATGEPTWQWASGSKGRLYDTVIWSSFKALQYECANGSDAQFRGCKLISLSDELHMYDATLIDSAVSGRKSTTDIMRIDAGTTIDGLAVGEFDTLDTVADTTTETLEISGVLFSGVTDLINVRNNKTWNVIDPIWDATTYTDFIWVGSTANAVNHKTSVTAIIQEADGTKLQNALLNVYENTQLADLVIEATTDVNGLASGSFLYKAHVTNSATTTYGGHALQAGKWLYLPFVATKISDEKLDGTLVLSPDNNIVQTTQATALTDGSGVTWNEDTNPSSVIEFTGGSGGTIGLAVGDTITGATSTADGIVTDILSGDGTAGTIHLKTRDANDFTPAGETIGNGADGWTATFTAGTQQDFSIWIDGNSKSFQTIYDYIAAKTTETTLSADGELIWEWCRDAQTQAFYATGSSFYTEQSNSKGIIVVNGGAGSIDYFTDDAGGTWTPPTSVTVQITVLDDSTGLPIATTAHVLMLKDSDKSEIMSQAVNGSGVASIPYNYVGNIDVVGWVREWNLTGDDYTPKNYSGTITASGLSLTIRLEPI